MVYDYAANKSKLCDTSGRRLTTGLFEELRDPMTVAPAVFKLSDWRKVYVALLDPTGYKAAYELIGDWDHWKLLVGNPIFKTHLDEWNEEVAAALKSKAIAALLKQSAMPTGTAAAKYLVEQGYVKKGKKKEAPSEVEDRASGDIKRLGLKAVK
jgi:hypothetical protein